MRKKATIFFILIVLVFCVALVWFVEKRPSVTTYVSESWNNASNNLAAVFFKESITIAELENKYNSAAAGRGKVRVLVVPGHEPNYGGADFKGLKERDMTVQLGSYLSKFLQDDGHYDVTVTRDAQNWNPVFSNYFTTQWNAIQAFAQTQKNDMKTLQDIGAIKSVSGTFHVNAPTDVALRLYGINKWANENKIDIEIHIHFNDYPRRNQSLPGDYSGFAIYVPDGQYSNSTTTKAIANAVFARLSKYNAVSNLGTESLGVVSDQDLIAVGANNNADSASLLIEYGYLYETEFQDPSVRNLVLKDLAYQTYLGLQDFFGQSSQSAVAFDTLVLPRSWQKLISKTTTDSSKTDVFALQSALLLNGEYPASGQNKNDCPRSGVFGPCTIDALKAFQNKYNINGEQGIVGTKTRSVLQSMYGL